MTPPLAGERPGARSALGLALLGSAALVLVWHSLRYNFVTDDAYISFVYARNLAEHGELVFNLGQYVEGYTNFSWTVLLSGLLALGIPPELSSRVLGTACGVAALGVAFLLTERALRRGSPWAGVPPLLLSLSSGFACWSSGGLETQLFTLLCLAALHRLACAVGAPPPRQARAFGALGLLVALAALTRPEGLLLGAALAAATVAWLIRGARGPAGGRAPGAARGLQLAALAAATFLAVWAPWFAWRLWYYGWPLPNTYYVKAHGPWQPPALAAEMWRNGGYYLLTWLRQTGLLFAGPVALWGLLATARDHALEEVRDEARLLTLTMTGFAAAYLLYAASVGGDFMGLHRFILPVFPIAAIGVGLGLRALGLRALGGTRAVSAARAGGRWLGLALVAGVVLAFAAQQRALTERSVRWGNFGADHGIDTPAFLKVYTDDRAAIGRALAGCLAPGDFSIVGGAGAQPYFARMRAIDVFGLVSEEVAHREPRIRARAGHTKFASDALLAELDPTFVFSCYALHRELPAPRLPCAAPWTARGFEQVTLRVPELRQSGTYYTFLAKRSRAFRCPGAVTDASAP